MTRLVASLATSGFKSRVSEHSEAVVDDLSEESSAILSFLDTITEEGFYDKTIKLFTSMPMYFKYVFAINVAIFIAWQVFPDFMARHALFSRSNLRNRRHHTILTSNFSQKGFAHLYGNMFFFVQAMLGLKDRFSGRALWAATVLASLTSTFIPYCLDSFKLWWLRVKHRIFQRKQPSNDSNSVAIKEGIIEGGSLGFSGVNSLLLYLLFWQHPNSSFNFFSQTITTRKVLELTCKSDIIGAIVNLLFFFTNLTFHSPIGHEAHLSGVLGGIFFRIMLESSVRVRQELDFGDQRRVPILQRVGDFFGFLKEGKKVYGELFPQINWNEDDE